MKAAATSMRFKTFSRVGLRRAPLEALISRRRRSTDAPGDEENGERRDRRPVGPQSGRVAALQGRAAGGGVEVLEAAAEDDVAGFHPPLGGDVDSNDGRSGPRFLERL